MVTVCTCSVMLYKQLKHKKISLWKDAEGLI